MRRKCLIADPSAARVAPFESPLERLRPLLDRNEHSLSRVLAEWIEAEPPDDDCLEFGGARTTGGRDVFERRAEVVLGRARLGPSETRRAQHDGTGDHARPHEGYLISRTRLEKPLVPA